MREDILLNTLKPLSIRWIFRQRPFTFNIESRGEKRGKIYIQANKMSIMIYGSLLKILKSMRYNFAKLVNINYSRIKTQGKR